MPIFDQGYQHWTGTLSGHTWRWLTITRQGIQVGMKSIVLRLLIIFGWMPAALLVAILCMWGLLENKSPLVSSLMSILSAFFPPEFMQDPRHYRVAVWTICFSRFLTGQLYVSMVVILLVGPGLISQDLRFNALPLYFSRPLRRIDYFIGKLGVIAYFLGLVIILPSLLAYVLGMLFSLDITIVWDTFPLLLGCLGYGLIVILSAGTLILAFSALTRNSRYVALFWLGLWFVTGITATSLAVADVEQRQSQMARKYSDNYANRRNTPANPAEFQTQRMEDEKNHRRLQAEFEQEEDRAARTNWRWLVSYHANLSRVGQALLRTEAAWEELSLTLPPEQRASFVRGNVGAQYPWFWSASVLAVLFGISVCILNFRIRSLDRLK
jgi:ABC-2 type transport system permease protein